ncbi:MAG: hypothetical protein ASARMPREDX12_003666 [Alectoria sarmentosa]|nr:MAG: hypothetical protein ASARMPREDX12_003666 [Alectoria sarmentosa]
MCVGSTVSQLFYATSTRGIVGLERFLLVSSGQLYAEDCSALRKRWESQLDKLMERAIKTWTMRLRQAPTITTIPFGCYPECLDVRRLLRIKTRIGLQLPMRGLLWEPWHVILLEGQTLYEELDLEVAYLLTMRCITRWAAKEAAIKAHRHRQLYMQNISIVRPILPPGSFSGTGTGGAQKLIALIDPPSDRIEMIRRVAALRGLRGFGLPNYGLHKGTLMSKDELHKEVQDAEDGKVHRGAHYYRRSRVKESDRQVAEINISHDGDYAVATCMAFDPPWSMAQEKTIVDKGEGLPLHEPQWGDEGWLDLAKPGIEGGSFGLEKERGLDMPLGNLLDEPGFPTDPDASKKAFKDVFENPNVPFLP